MKRLARIIVGVALIAAQVTMLFLRHHPPLNGWAPSGSFQGLILQGASSAALLGGLWLIASARPTNRAPGGQQTTSAEDDAASVAPSSESQGNSTRHPNPESGSG